MPEEDFINCDFPDLDSFIRQLDLLKPNVKTAVSAAMSRGADMIKNEQKRLISGKSSKLAAAIDTSDVEVTKGGALKVTSGYQRGAFERNGRNFVPGVVGMVYEYGRPGQSHYRAKPTAVRRIKGKKFTYNKGAIQPVPHIRRGFDNVKNQAAQEVIDAYNREMDKLKGK